MLENLVILLVSVFAAAGTVLLGKLDQPRNLKLVTAFTGSYMMGITCLHLMPEVFAHAHDEIEGANWKIGAFVLAGFFLQVVLENFSRGLEHGHEHPTSTALPFSMLAGLCIHAFLEAAPLGSGTGHDHGHTHNTGLLLVAIVIHKYPVAIVLLAMLLQSGIPRPKAFFLFGVFAAMAPLGALVGNISLLASYHNWMLAIVIGIFMHVATTILFESEEGHRFNLQKGIAIIVGAGLAILSVTLSTH